MKTCPKCGNIIENDNAKFCRKCGAKQPEIVVEKQESIAINSTPKDGILLSDLPKRQLLDDGGQTLSSNFTNKKPISSSFASPIVATEEKGLLWAVKTCFRKYATFKGRASRSEYWFFCLFNCIISSILFGLAIAINQESISLIFLGLTFVYTLVVFLPALAVTVRRLHDIGKSGWLYCIVFIPYVGAFILLYFLCKKGDSGENNYGMPN